MEMHRIVTYGNEILRMHSENIEEFSDEIRDIIPQMYVTLHENRGVGLAGPQVGLLKRIFVYDVGEGSHTLINPKLIHARGEEWGVEGCLSIPGLQGEVPRYERVVVTGINEDGKQVKIKAEGFLARVFQHEMDHLEGVLFIDKADPETLETIGVDEIDEDDLEVEGETE